METEIIACEKKEKFVSYQISRLIDSDFGKKPQKCCVLILTFFTRLSPAATLPTPGLSAPAPVYTPIYLM